MRIVFNLETVAALVVIAFLLGAAVGALWRRRG